MMKVAIDGLGGVVEVGWRCMRGGLEVDDGGVVGQVMEVLGIVYKYLSNSKTS